MYSSIYWKLKEFYIYKEEIFLKELFVKNVVNETTDFLDNNKRIKLKEILVQM